jgi:hypothetical protein
MRAKRVRRQATRVFSNACQALGAASGRWMAQGVQQREICPKTIG